MVDGLSQNGHLATDEELEECYLTDQEGASWEDVKELLVLEHSMYSSTLESTTLLTILVPNYFVVNSSYDVCLKKT